MKILLMKQKKTKHTTELDIGRDQDHIGNIGTDHDCLADQDTEEVGLPPEEEVSLIIRELKQQMNQQHMSVKSSILVIAILSLKIMLSPLAQLANQS